MNRYTMETIESWKAMPHEFVSVDEEKLRACAMRAAREELMLPRWDAAGVHPRNNRAFLTHIFWHNAVNFAFTHFGGKRRDGGLHCFETQTCFGERVVGSFAMGACFYRAFGEQLIYAKDMLRHCETLVRLKKFFRGYTGMPLLGERRELLLDACLILERDFAGNPWNIWEEGRFRAYGIEQEPGIVDVLNSKFPGVFQDEAELRVLNRVLKFFFNKRAHLAVMMYQGRAEYAPKELPRIRDIYELGPVPDYVLPQTYQSDGIFEYSAELEGMIASGIAMSAGSQMELEIRGATVFVQAHELELENKKRRYLGLPPRHIGHIDYSRWRRAGTVSGNHHLCKTTAY